MGESNSKLCTATFFESLFGALIDAGFGDDKVKNTTNNISINVSIGGPKTNNKCVNKIQRSKLLPLIEFL